MCLPMLLTVLAAAPAPEGLPTIEDLIRATPPVEMARLGREAVAALGTYRYRMTKQERVGGRLLDEQQIVTCVREKPLAVRMDYVAGPAKDRRLVFNSTSRPDEFRVREPGFAWMFGPLWFSLDASQAKSDTNHSVRDSSLTSMMTRLATELDRAGAQGRVGMQHEGWNAAGHWCVTFTAPQGGRGFAAAKTRVCSDVKSRLVTALELFDAEGRVLERYAFSGFEVGGLDDSLFDPEKL